MTAEGNMAHPRDEAPGSASRAAEDLLGPVNAAVRQIEAQFSLVVGRADRVEAACAKLDAALSDLADPTPAGPCLVRLVALLRSRQGDVAQALVPFLRAQASRGSHGHAIAVGLLAARDPEIRRHGVQLALEGEAEQKLAFDAVLLNGLAETLAEAPDLAADPAILQRIAPALRRLSISPGHPDLADPLEAILLHGPSPAVRKLAAIVLDQAGTPVPRERLVRLFGADAAEVLAPHIEYTRATHQSLVDLTPDRRLSPVLLESLRESERALGRPLLGSILGELGWDRVAWGIACHRLVGLSLDGGFPVAVTRAEAMLLESCGPVRRVWDRFLVVAHGGSAAAEDDRGDDAAVVQRFREYNILHAELLGDILEVAPVTPAKVGRILDRLGRAVGHFAALFRDHTEDAARVEAHFAALRERVERSIAGAPPDQPLGAEATRLVQMFEDPRSLDEVRTLHGLKRYLHQQGLRHAFRVFRSGRATNRTVDLALANATRVLQIVRRIRYIDFEPDPGADPRDLPFPVAMATEVLGRRLVHGKAETPDFEILVYGNEVQVFISFRNHPVFLRMDLSPPERGGMLDLEFFGVSQYELDSHPDPSLRWIQRLFRRLDFDVQAEEAKLHIRYDKEHARDLGDLLAHARVLGFLLPHLMELDWVIGSLDYPEPVKGEIADGWADFVTGWGWLPLAELLTTDRRHVLLGRAVDPAGEREILWDGRGEYRDRFLGVPDLSAWDRIRAQLVASGLSRFVPWEEPQTPPVTQLHLEARLFNPLREAISLGHLLESHAGPVPTAAGAAGAAHEAEQLARLLVQGGEALAESARIAYVVSSIERNLRFVTSGSIHGYPVEHARLALRGEQVDLYVLRDDEGIARLALAEDCPLRTWPSTRGGSHHLEDPRLSCRELVRRLRRDNYVAPGYEAPIDGKDEAALAAAVFAVPNALAPPGVSPGDLVVQGIVSSPGRAAGFVRLGLEGRTPEEMDGAILFARAIRPEDTPFIRRCAAVVTTGGGILNHAGLIALELHKPALLISGRWRRDPAGSDHLAYRYLDFHEEEEMIGPFPVVIRRDLREREEQLREGDLVVVDAEVGTLGVLGRDRDALALQQELAQLDTVAAEMNREGPGTRLLTLRGKWLRAVHQLQRLIARLDRPALARYAARELLFARRAPSAAVGRDDLGTLLDGLLANQACGAIAREAAQQLRSELQRRLDAYGHAAHRIIPAATSVPEILHLRLAVHRVRQRLSGLNRLLREAGFDAPDADPDAEVDRLVRRRLDTLHADLIRTIESSDRSAEAAWALPHLQDRLDVLHRVLAVPAEGAPIEMASDRAVSDPPAARSALGALAGRCVLDAKDGGRELAPLIGGKAANLGEISRILGAAPVPRWFSVTDTAFRAIVEAPPGRTAAAVGLDPDACASMAGAIEEILGRRDFLPARKAAAIRQLWQGAALPPRLAEEITSAYRALNGADPTLSPDGSSALPFVAIRSSAFEEDRVDTSWAGQFDTFLFVRGEESVLEHVKLAMAGLWTERAIEQREFSGGGAGRGGGGVIVQRIVDARVAGVLHTLSPAAGQARELVINVGLGLGEGVVSGTVEVDHIVVSREADVMDDPLRFHYQVGDKTSRVVFDRKTGSGTRREETLYHQRLRPALEYSDLCELVSAALRLEQTYGYPLDIEFAFEDDALYILQVRPIVAFQDALRETMEQAPLPAPGAGEK